MKRLIAVLSILLIGLLLAACASPAPAPAVEAPAASPTPPPIPTAVPAAEDSQSAPAEPAEPADEPTAAPDQPTAEPTAADTFGTSAVDALAQDYVSCVETEPHPIGEQIAATYDVPYEEVMKLFCNGDIFDDILIAYQTRDLTGVGVGELLDRHAIAGGWDAVWQDLGLLDQ